MATTASRSPCGTPPTHGDERAAVPAASAARAGWSEPPRVGCDDGEVLHERFELGVAAD